MATKALNTLNNTAPHPIFLEDHAAVSSHHDLPAFTVSLTRGFLPRVDPPAQLPPAFAPLESLLQRMPILTASGGEGLLNKGTFGDTVLSELPDLTTEIEKVKEDQILIGALYRDYSFLASAYLLEPCHLRYVKGEPYGLGRDRLPAVIARPLAQVAKIAGFAPFMEYAGSYALYNYRLVEPPLGLTYSNLRLVRAFEHGVADETSSEAGFVLVHIDMVKHSGELVSGTVAALDACAEGDREAFDRGLSDVVEAMRKVNLVMNSMWNKSKPREYTNFRTFIFGITSQSMFPDGVIYEGLDDDEPKAFRGESGANDSMLACLNFITDADTGDQIPLCDNLLQLTEAMPPTPLTEILRDFRSYRPGSHRAFLECIQQTASVVGLKDYAMRDARSAALYLMALDQVRDFRWRHWCFAKEYILKQTSHPTATGGSPIVSWLPNQLQAVLDAMMQVQARFQSIAGDAASKLKGCDEIMETASSQQRTLKKEVEKFCVERGVSA